MSEKKTKPYPSEFKESSVKLALESKESIGQTARNLGIKVSTLHTWITQYSKPKERNNMRNDEHIYDEVKRLKKELAKVTEERDLLKKAAAYFAKESK